MRRKLTRASLRELALTMKPISNDRLETMMGCGNGTFRDPFTHDEFACWNGSSETAVFYYDTTGLLCCNLPEVFVDGHSNGSTVYQGGSDLYSWMNQFANNFSDEGINRSEQVASSFSINTSVKEAIINLARDSEGFEGACKTYLNFTKFCGKTLGGFGVGISLIRLAKQPNVANLFKAVVSVASLSLGPGGTLIYSTLEVSGAVDYIADAINQHIDHASF